MTLTLVGERIGGRRGGRGVRDRIVISRVSGCACPCVALSQLSVILSLPVASRWKEKHKWEMEMDAEREREHSSWDESYAYHPVLPCGLFCCSDFFPFALPPPSSPSPSVAFLPLDDSAAGGPGCWLPLHLQRNRTHWLGLGEGAIHACGKDGMGWEPGRCPARPGCIEGPRVLSCPILSCPEP